MVLNVDLQCSKCYKKVKKLLCKFDEIRDQEYDEKANKVLIKVVCCSPEKIRDKLCSKGGGCIKSIEIKKPDEKKPDGKKPTPPKAKPKDEPVKPPPSKEPEPNDDEEPIRTQPGSDERSMSYLRYPPPASSVIGLWCSEGSSHGGMPGNPCYRGWPVQYVGYYGRPIYDSWSGGWCDYFSEENQQSCSIV